MKKIYVITFDADNQFYTSDINKLLINLGEYDIVILTKNKIKDLVNIYILIFFTIFLKFGIHCLV